MVSWTTDEESRLAAKYTVDEYLTQHIPESNHLPWEKLPHESMTAYLAFCAYRDAGRKRSIAYVRGKGIGIANIWVQEYRWTLRARHYDEYVMVEEQIEQHKLNRETRTRHAQQALEALDGLMAPFQEYQRRLESDPELLQQELAAMPAAKLLSTMQASARVLQPIMSAERLSRDLPTEMVETHHSGQITVQDNPEALIELLGVLKETGVGDALFGKGQIVDLVESSDQQVDTYYTPSEAASLPAGST